MLLISLSSILLSIMILLLPFIAKCVVSGEIGSTMLTVVGVAAQSAVAGWVGMQVGFGGGGGFRTPRRVGPPTPPAEIVAAIGAGGGGERPKLTGGKE